MSISQSFIVSVETSERPRLYVGFCSVLDEIQGTDFTNDGPLGGGNDYVRLNAINGWFINHKTEISFYEAYRDAGACRKSTDFVPMCNKSLVLNMIEDKRRKV